MNLQELITSDPLTLQINDNSVIKCWKFYIIIYIPYRWMKYDFMQLKMLHFEPKQRVLHLSSEKVLRVGILVFKIAFEIDNE